MDLRITDVIKASRFEPIKPTYGLGIFSSWTTQRDKELYTLKPSQNWVHIAEYTFDDIWPEILEMESNPSRPYVMFNDGMADMLVREFAEYVSRCEALLVYCSRGINRSPAVAIGLNDAFDLGHDPDELREQYKGSNWYVCSLVAEAGFRYLGKDPSQNEIKTTAELDAALGLSGLRYVAKVMGDGFVNMLYTNRGADEKMTRRILRKSKRHFSATTTILSGPSVIEHLGEYGFDTAALTPEQIEQLRHSVEIHQFKKK
jgi:hypothetical protein